MNAHIRFIFCVSCADVKCKDGNVHGKSYSPAPFTMRVDEKKEEDDGRKGERERES